MTRLVVVSNRVSIPRSGQPQTGGLAVALTGALKEQGGLWFGWNGKVTQGEPEGPEVLTQEGVTYITIPLSQADYDAYYMGFSNEVLWPVFHFMPSTMEYRRADLEGYRRVNRLFAEHLVELLEGDEAIWVHDYHLMHLAEELREAGVRQPIGFFLHIPFPSYDVLRAVPGHRDLLAALCRFDVIGLQTPSDQRAFRDAVVFGLGGKAIDEQTLEYGGRRIHVGDYPVGTDVEDLASIAEKSSRTRRVGRLLQSLAGRDLVIGVDRLDYSKGLPNRLLAYERLLENSERREGRTVLMQIANPSRSRIPEYAELRRELEELAGRINGRYADFDWVPIRYLNRSFARPSLMGFFRTARVGLVTPLRDGMNLVAKEYVACQDPEDPGVLVLSELAGASNELSSALLVNPFDVDAIAEALERALAMPLRERQERHAQMLTVLRKHSLTHWRNAFLSRLEAAGGTA